jgi:hypothetical protein
MMSSGKKSPGSLRHIFSENVELLAEATERQKLAEKVEMLRKQVLSQGEEDKEYFVFSVSEAANDGPPVDAFRTNQV